MTRKDYQIIASAIRSTYPGDGTPWDTDQQMLDRSAARNQWRIVAEMMAHSLSDENPRFDREKFLSACGL